VVEAGTLAELRHLTRTSVDAEVVEVPDGMHEIAGVHDLVVEGRRVRFQVETAALGRAVGVLHGAGLRSLVAHPPTLEELFLRHYGDVIPAAEAEREPA
jgi:ABC-2 type transport system ATP-binding protein